MGIAASIALVMGATYFVLFSGQTDPQQLYAQYYKPYPNIVAPAQRSDSNTPNPGLALYEAGNYTEALKVFNQQMAEGNDEAYMLFYAGVAALNTNEESDAIAYFEKVIHQQNETFANPAQWYLGLTHLKLGQNKEAVRIFEEIKASGNDYSQRASEILENL